MAATSLTDLPQTWSPVQISWNSCRFDAVSTGILGLNGATGVFSGLNGYWPVFQRTQLVEICGRAFAFWMPRLRRAVRSAYHYINSQLREKLRELRTEGLTSPWRLQPLAMLSDASLRLMGCSPIAWVEAAWFTLQTAYVYIYIYTYIYIYMHKRAIAKMILLVHVGTVNQDRPAASAWLWTKANLPALHCNSMTDLILTMSN